VLVNLWLWLGSPGPGQQWWPQSVLGLVVALDPAQLSPGGPAVVLVLPVHGLGRDRSAAGAAVWLAAGRLAPGQHDAWAAPALAAGFAAILLWEELADLEHTAWLSSCLLLLITAGAVIGSLRFEKRFWCRYLCPVGGMNGLFAKLSILELRAEQGHLQRQLQHLCLLQRWPRRWGGPGHGGLPACTHPAHLRGQPQLRALPHLRPGLPHRSVQLSLRPPAADLQREMVPPAGEAGLILVLAGGVCLKFWSGCWGLGAGSS